ncbi:hypothetical protein BAE44_0010278, partial [Dichanthelium oligosanthes]
LIWSPPSKKGMRTSGKKNDARCGAFNQKNTSSTEEKKTGAWAPLCSKKRKKPGCKKKEYAYGVGARKKGGTGTGKKKRVAYGPPFRCDRAPWAAKASLARRCGCVREQRRWVARMPPPLPRHLVAKKTARSLSKKKFQKWGAREEKKVGARSEKKMQLATGLVVKKRWRFGGKKKVQQRQRAAVQHAVGGAIWSAGEAVGVGSEKNGRGGSEKKSGRGVSAIVKKKGFGELKKKN